MYYCDERIILGNNLGVIIRPVDQNYSNNSLNEHFEGRLLKATPVYVSFFQKKSFHDHSSPIRLLSISYIKCLLRLSCYQECSSSVFKDQ